MRKLLLAAMLAAMVAAPAAPGASRASGARFWKNHSENVKCGERVPRRTHFQLLCHPQRGLHYPGGCKRCALYLGLRRRGRSQVVDARDPWSSGKPTILPDGTTWSRGGISCSVGQTVTCKNTSGHGFTIGNGRVKKF